VTRKCRLITLRFIAPYLSQLLRFIKELKPHYQEVIQLRFFEMSYQEIANKIEEPLSNVKIKLLRAKNYWQKLFR
jgi:RNA polymerase sigma-70 factor (ECF subfamily)